MYHFPLHRIAILRGRVGWQDAVAAVLVLGSLILLGTGMHQALAPFAPTHPLPISLSPAALPMYTLYTVLRMLAAMLASLLFTFSYATLAAKSRRAEMVLIPILDALQSVPILGYLSFTVVFFVALVPGKLLGPELAAIFAIFTSQAWNMAFSFYQSLRTVPTDLIEASRSIRSSAWQRFWNLEVPFAMPGLIWNMMMSMSGGWFFVVASEAISVGDLQIALPGVGSYVASAIAARDLGAVGWAIVAMSVAIVLYDQLLFRPLIAWADKFRSEQTAAQVVPRSWMLDLFRRSSLIDAIVGPFASAWDRMRKARFALPPSASRERLFAKLARRAPPRRVVDMVWMGTILAGVVYLGWQVAQYVSSSLSWADLRQVAVSGAVTLLRVGVLVAIATVVWVPIGVAVGLRPTLTARIQPIAQFLAAFPANLFFPAVVVLIVRFALDPKIWLPPLMILGTQWYILFNVIAGASAVPTDLREAAASFRIGPAKWWIKIMLPGIFPYYVTGAITAAGGAWNASIVSEAVSWGSTKLNAGGLGAYIAQMTEAGDYPRIALGVAIMSALVIATNRLLWRPLYLIAERRTRLD